MVRSMVFLGSVLYILGLLLTDISYTLVDPRVRLRVGDDILRSSSTSSVDRCGWCGCWSPRDRRVRRWYVAAARRILLRAVAHGVRGQPLAAWLAARWSGACSSRVGLLRFAALIGRGCSIRCIAGAHEVQLRPCEDAVACSTCCVVLRSRKRARAHLLGAARHAAYCRRKQMSGRTARRSREFPRLRIRRRASAGSSRATGRTCRCTRLPWPRARGACVVLPWSGLAMLVAARLRGISGRGLARGLARAKRRCRGGDAASRSALLSAAGFARSRARRRTTTCSAPTRSGRTCSTRR